MNGNRLVVGDGLAATDERRLTIVAHEDSELILVETSLESPCRQGACDAATLER